LRTSGETIDAYLPYNLPVSASVEPGTVQQPPLDSVKQPAMEIAGLTLGLTSLSLQQLKKIAKNDVIPPPRRKFPWRKLRGDGSNAIAAPGQKCPRRKPRDGDISRSMKKLEVDEESSAAESDGSLDNGNSEDNDSDNEDPLKDVLWPVSPVEIYMFYTKFEFLVKDNSECGVSRIEHFLHSHTNVQDSRNNRRLTTSRVFPC